MSLLPNDQAVRAMAAFAWAAYKDGNPQDQARDAPDNVNYFFPDMSWHVLTHSEFGPSLEPFYVDHGFDGYFEAIQTIVTPGNPPLFATAGALVAYNSTTKTVVLSFRGSENLADLAVAGNESLVSQHYDLFHPLIEAVISFVIANNTTLLVTGHSLGGAMAEIFMAENPDSLTFSATFASIGSMRAASNVANAIHFEDTDDIFAGNITDDHIGKVVRISNLISGTGGLVDMPVPLAQAGAG